VHTASQKYLSASFREIIFQRLKNFNRNYSHLLRIYTLHHKKNFIQLSRKRDAVMPYYVLPTSKHLHFTWYLCSFAIDVWPPNSPYL